MKPRKYGWRDNTVPYRQWRYQWDHGAVHDVDQVEWRDDQPVAVLELTSAQTLDDKTKANVAGRLWNQFSGRKLRYLALRMGVPLYVVLFTPAVDRFSVCNLRREDSPWCDYPPGGYRSWLCGLPLQSTGAVANEQ